MKLRRIKERCETIQEVIVNTEIALDYLAYKKKLPGKDSVGAPFFIFLDDDKVAIKIRDREHYWQQDYQKLCAHFEPLGYKLSHTERKVPRYKKPNREQRLYVTIFIY